MDRGVDASLEWADRAVTRLARHSVTAYPFRQVSKQYSAQRTPLSVLPYEWRRASWERLMDRHCGRLPPHRNTWIRDQPLRTSQHA
ncbi:hypothetical protein BN2364_3945 [Alloalcanivorax xenomutans]|nr:hypothetical protein BN2364_3945 [Alloalcanivorax xenomutans]